MTPLARAIAVILITLAAGAAGFWLGHQRGGGGGAPEHDGDEKAAATTEPAEEPRPVVTVSTTPLKKSTIEQTISAYGSVVAPSGDVRIVSVAFESRVGRAVVAAGQQVAAGDALLDVEASPDALILLQEAKTAFAGAAQELKRVQQQFAAHLATNVELTQAQGAFDSAKLKLDSLTQRGVGQKQTLKADVPGVVSKVDVQEGQIVPAGGALVEIATGNRIEVALGVEPADAASLSVGQSVKVTPVGSSGKPIAGKVQVVAHRVDLATRLTSVLVTLPPEAHLMLDSFVSGQIVRTVPDALVVPRDTILNDEDGGYAVFTVDHDHAKKHDVHVGVENDREAQIISDELKPGDAIVIRNQYQLEDGDEVKVEPMAPATTETTTPATTEAAK